MVEARSSESIQSFIVDAEIVAVSPSEHADHKESTFRLLPFQILSTRRGTKVSSAPGKTGDTVQVRIYAFDLMYLNGKSLLDKPLFQRVKALRESFCETHGFTFASSMEIPSFDEAKITAYLLEAVEGGAEGLMMKLTGIEADNKGTTSTEDNIPRLVCNYESGTRSQTWLKVKRDYVKQFGDSIDVVPIGAWFGNGRKAIKGFLSPVLLAVYDDEDDVFLSISRCMSFTDNMYAATKQFYFNGTPFPPSLGLDDGKESNNVSHNNSALDDESNPGSDADEDLVHENEESNDDTLDDTAERVNCFPHRPSSAVYKTNENPTLWFKPLEVWEVAFADLTLSRVHRAAAGLVDDADGRGVAMRFPRFIRRRPDKTVEQATTSRQIAQLFAKQFKQA
jgi:DNA ligase-1